MIVWHRRHKHPDSFWVVVVAPIIAIAGQVFALYLLFANIDVLAGTIGYVDLINSIAIVGVVDRPRLRVLCSSATNRKKFDMIGRMIDEGEIDEAPGSRSRELAAARSGRGRAGARGLERRLPAARSAAALRRARRRARRCRS